VRRWAERGASQRADVLCIGYFGSYARGDWGVGSDLDLVVLLTDSAVPFERRAAEWDLSELPVPADLLIYTEDEWRSLGSETGFLRAIEEETVWLCGDVQDR
jgi:predicted nucleotidyltransferase